MTFTRIIPSPFEVPRPIMTRTLFSHLRNRSFTSISVTEFDSLELARQRRTEGGTDDEVVQEVSSLSLTSEVADAARASVASRNVNAVATALERELMRDASSFSHRFPLSVLPVVDFLLRKKIEADNLRAIAYGKQTQLPNETIQELIIQ